MRTTSTDLERSRLILDRIAASAGGFGGPGTYGDDMITIAFPDDAGLVSKKFAVHRSLLMTMSPVFRDMLSAQNTGRAYFESVLDVDTDTFAVFVHMIYGGKLEGKKFKDVLGVLKFCAKYRCANEVEICIDWMKENAGKGDLKAIWELASEVDNKDMSNKLQDVAFDVAKKLYKEYVKTDYYRLHTWKAFKRLFASVLDSEDPYLVFKYSMKWFKKDPGNRIQHLDEILKKIKWDKMTKAELAHALENPIAQGSPSFGDIVKRALRPDEYETPDPYGMYWYQPGMNFGAPPMFGGGGPPPPPGPPGFGGGPSFGGPPPGGPGLPGIMHEPVPAPRPPPYGRYPSFFDNSVGTFTSETEEHSDSSSTSDSSDCDSESTSYLSSSGKGDESRTDSEQCVPHVGPWNSAKVAAYFNFHYKTNVTKRHRQVCFMFEHCFWKLKGRKTKEGHVGLFLYLLDLSSTLDPEKGIDISIKMFARNRLTGERWFEKGFSEVNTMKVNRCFGWERLIKKEQLRRYAKMLIGKHNSIILGVEIRIHPGAWCKGKAVFKDTGRIVLK